MKFAKSFADPQIHDSITNMWRTEAIFKRVSSYNMKEHRFHKEAKSIMKLG